MTTDPTPDPAPDTAPDASDRSAAERSRRLPKRRSLLAAGLVAAVATAGVGGAALAGSPLGVEGGTPLRSAPSSVEDLGDVTLDELADQLAELGLEVSVAPVGSVDGAIPDGDGFADPFEGMSDAEIDALSDEEFEQLLDDADLEDGDGHDHGDEPDSLGTFAVDGDRIDTSAATPEVAESAEQIWSRFVQLIPADQRTMVTSFSLDPAAASGAWVAPDEKDPTTWALGVSEGLGDDLDDVLIHEFGHLLTLQAEEVPPSDDAEGCTTYFTGEGCALTGSTFAEFVERFWPQSLLDELADVEESGDDAAFDEFYEKHRDDFVTDYATTNPGEDLAETFTAFVTTDRPTGTTVADQKVQMLWDDPDMVDLREQIRANR